MVVLETLTPVQNFWLPGFLNLERALIGFTVGRTYFQCLSKEVRACQVLQITLGRDFRLCQMLQISVLLP